MRLIGLTGFKGAGKDAVYNCIYNMRHPNESVGCVAIGDKVKELGGRALGFGGQEEDVTDAINEIKRHARIIWESTFSYPYLHPGGELSMRAYIQDLGHACRGMFGEDFWIDQVLPRGDTMYDSRHELKAAYPSVDTLVVTDVRYPNEAQRVIDLDGKIIEIVKPGLESDGKPSETPLPREMISAKVINDAGLYELHFVVKEALLCM